MRASVGKVTIQTRQPIPRRLKVEPLRARISGHTEYVAEPRLLVWTDVWCQRVIEEVNECDSGAVSTRNYSTRTPTVGS